MSITNTGRHVKLPDNGADQAIGRTHLRQLTVSGVVDLASALHERIHPAQPEEYHKAYCLALDLVNSGVVDVLVDGKPGFQYIARADAE